MTTPHDRLSSRQQRLAEVMANPVLAEQVELKVTRFRPHARHLFWSALIFIALAGAVPFYMNTFQEEWQNIAFLAGAALAGLLFVLAPFVSWLARTTTISTRRIIMRSGVFTQHRTEVHLAQVGEVRLKRGIIQRLFGAGNIVLQSTLGSQVILRNVPGVVGVAESLRELVHWQHRVGSHGLSTTT